MLQSYFNSNVFKLKLSSNLQYFFYYPSQFNSLAILNFSF